MSTVSHQKHWTYRCIVVLVIAVHALVLYSITGLLSRPDTIPKAFSGTVFSTRTIELGPTIKTTPTITQPTSANVSTPKKTSSKVTVANHSEHSLADSPAEPTTTSGTEIAGGNHASNEAPKTEAATEQIPDATLQPQATDIQQSKAQTQYAVPSPVLLKYDIKGEIKGFAYFAYGQLIWQHNGGNYDAQLEISHFLLGSRTQTSSGQITDHGLEPLRFADKVRSEVSAQLDHAQSKVTFSGDGSHTQLEVGAQDQLSVFLQLSALLGGDPQQYKAGDHLPFQAVGARSSEQWIFEIGKTESLTLPGGAVQAIKLTRNPPTDGAPKVEVWLAPSMQYLPVRIRLTQGDGDFVEQQWRSTKKP